MSANDMTTSEVLRGKLLSPETVRLMLNEISLLTESLTNAVFGADPVERENAILAYVEQQAKRAVLMTLVKESAETYRELSELDTPRRG